MDEKLTEKNIKDDEFILNSEEIDYLDLINRLKEIRSTIASLDKKYLEKF